MKNITLLLLVATLVVAPAGLAFAQRGGPPHGPPPEAFEACEGLEEGDACEFEGPHGTIDGTCGTRRGDDFHCVPNRPPPRRQ